MTEYERLPTVTLPVRHPKEGLWYLPLRKELREQLRIFEGCSVELEFLRVYAKPPPMEAKKK